MVAERRASDGRQRGGASGAQGLADDAGHAGARREPHDGGATLHLSRTPVSAPYRILTGVTALRGKLVLGAIPVRTECQTDGSAE
jgi:hypothetical protein